MFSFVVVAALALTAAQASLLPCGSGLALGGVVSGLSALPLGDRVVANNCQCLKTIVRPQLNQRVIDIPTTRRLVQNSISNIVQNIPYTTGGAIDTPFLESGVLNAAPLGVGYGTGSIDAVGPLRSISGCGAPLIETVAPLNALGGSVFSLGAGYSGLNDVILGGNGIAPCGCGY